MNQQKTLNVIAFALVGIMFALVVIAIQLSSVNKTPDQKRTEEIGQVIGTYQNSSGSDLGGSWGGFLIDVDGKTKPVPFDKGSVFSTMSQPSYIRIVTIGETVRYEPVNLVREASRYEYKPVMRSLPN